MIPVHQTRFAIELPLTEAPGNCWAACIASILEVGLEEVPDESMFWKPGMSHQESWRMYQPAVVEWVNRRGWELIEIKCESLFVINKFEAFCIISGPSPRNPAVNHAVVGKGNNIVFDPHPSGDGLVEVEGREWWYEFFVPADAARMVLR